MKYMRSTPVSETRERDTAPRPPVQHVCIRRAGEVRWVLPADQPARSAAAHLLTGHTAAGRVFQALVAAGWVGREPAVLSDFGLGGAAEWLEEVFRVRNLQVAVSLGTPGAYRKITLQVITLSGVVLGYVKIGRTPGSQDALDREAAVLNRLGTFANMHGRLPEVLHHGRWQDARVLVLTSGPLTSGSRRLTHAHWDFLRLLSSHSHACVTDGATFVAESISPNAPSIPLILGHSCSGLVERTLERIARRLSGVELRLCLTHGDFAPWNTKVDANGLYVYDWESARDARPALFDAFHFVSVQAALRNQLPPIVTRSLAEFVEALAPELQQVWHDVYLAYLLDTAAYYARAHQVAPTERRGVTLEWYVRSIRALADKGQ